MSKKFGKFLLFSAVAGVAAYGAYQYLQTKDQTASPAGADDADDDLDDFNEDLDEEPAAEPERSYVALNLDKAAAIASESFHKAKEVIVDSVQQVRDTVKSVTEGQTSSETNFTDLTALKRESEASKAESAESETEAPKAESAESVAESPKAESAEPEAETPKADPVKPQTEDFFTQKAPEDEVSPLPSNDEAKTPVNSSSSNTVEEFFDDNDSL